MNNMKRFISNCMTIALMAFGCVAFIACDNEKDDDSENVHGRLIADGLELSFSYGYYNHDNIDQECWSIWFYDFDYGKAAESQDRSLIPSNFNMMGITLRTDTIVSDRIPTGDFTSFQVKIIENAPRADRKTYEYNASILKYHKIKADGKLTVTKNDDYKVTISDIELYAEGAFEGIGSGTDVKPLFKNASFTYSGKLDNY